MRPTITKLSVIRSFGYRAGMATARWWGSGADAGLVGAVGAASFGVVDGIRDGGFQQFREFAQIS